ncbi:MAG: diguanylate cyclase [Bradymonadia bacterium]|jgi:diguanylate cyclase
MSDIERTETRSDADRLVEMMAFARETGRTIASLRNRVDELERLCDTDELTGCSNRRGWLRSLDRALARLRRGGLGGCVAYLDMNNFKNLNDSLGHQAGDAMLAHVADVLSKTVRPCDCVGRIGGDEFVVLLESATLDGAQTALQRINDAFTERPFRWASETIIPRASIGVAVLRATDTPSELIQRADASMYEVKRHTRKLPALTPADDSAPDPSLNAA